MSFRPLRDRVLLKRIESEGRTAGGVIVPDTAKERPMEAKAVAIGRGRRAKDGTTIPIDVQVGQHVLIGRRAGTEVQIGHENFLIVGEEDFFGVVEFGSVSTRAA